MALTTAERNKRKRERKKRERAEAQKLQQQQLEEAANKSQKEDDDDVQVEIEYVAEPPPENHSNNINNQGGDDDQDLQAVMRRFQDRAALVYVTDGEDANNTNEMGTSDNISAKENHTDNLNDDEDNSNALSKTKLKAMFRPTVAALKQRSLNPEL
eukprot:scaffold16950_cov67-Skeletonema_dohrnii-CCMP3373.AAC.1